MKHQKQKKILNTVREKRQIVYEEFTVWLVAHFSQNNETRSLWYNIFKELKEKPETDDQSWCIVEQL